MSLDGRTTFEHDRLAEAEAFRAIHFLNLGGPRMNRARHADAGEVAEDITSRREMVAEIHHAVGAHLAVIAHPVAILRAAANSAGLERRIDGFKDRGQRVVNRHEMPGPHGFDAQRDHEAVADFQIGGILQFAFLAEFLIDSRNGITAVLRGLIDD